MYPSPSSEPAVMLLHSQGVQAPAVRGFTLQLLRHTQRENHSLVTPSLTWQHQNRTCLMSWELLSSPLIQRLQSLAHAVSYFFITLHHRADMMTFTVVTQDEVKPEMHTATRSQSQERNYLGEKENPALNLERKCQCLQLSLDGFFFCSTGRFQELISWL